MSHSRSVSSGLGVDVASTAIVSQGEGEAVHIPAHHMSVSSHDVPHPPLGHGGGVGGGDLGGLSAAGQLVQALLATWQLVTVRGGHGADLNLSKKIYIRFKKKKCCLHSRPRD